MLASKLYTNLCIPAQQMSGRTSVRVRVRARARVCEHMSCSISVRVGARRRPFFSACVRVSNCFCVHLCVPRRVTV